MAFGELLTDREEDRTLRAVLVVGMLREGDHTSRQAGRHGSIALVFGENLAEGV